MHRIIHIPRRVGLALLTALVLTVSGCSNRSAEESVEAPPDRTVAGSVAAAAPEQVAVSMRVLLLDDGESMPAAILDRLTTEGVPSTVVPLTDPGRQRITWDLLASADSVGARASFAGIVYPAADSTLLSAEEHAVIREYQRVFGVRAVETHPSDNKDIPRPGYEGPLPGATAQVTEAGRAGGFDYLQGTVSLDNDFDAEPIWGVLTAASLRPEAGAEFVPLVTTALPGTELRAPLVAVQRADGVENLILGFNGDAAQTPTQVISHGIVNWLTRGVSTSINRQYLSVHFDDVLLPNAQWSVEGQCEVGRNCPPEYSDLKPVRMVAEDIPALVDWQEANGLKLDVVLNGAGAKQYAADHGHRDPLSEAVTDHGDELRIISHTWTHRFLGCEREILPDDWECRTDAEGNTLWLDQQTIAEELVTNTRFMAKNGFEHYDPKEIVTGEHSGLVHAPQQMVDNPNLAPAIDDAGIEWVASDASEAGEMWPRPLGQATTVPRYPVDLDYNTPTARQVVSQFNWLFTTSAEGGSGLCETNEDYAPCVAPLDLESGFYDVIAAGEGRKMFEHMARNDPRPHYLHQSNLTGDRLAYPIIDIALAEYRATYGDSMPLLNPTMTEAGVEMVRQKAWRDGRDAIEATVSGRVVTLRNTGQQDLAVPLTVPEGAQRVSNGKLVEQFGEAYGGSRSAWVTVPAGEETVVQLDQPAGYAPTAAWPPVVVAG